MGELHVEREQRVTPLELFFDLVFAFTRAPSACLMTRVSNAGDRDVGHTSIP